MSVLTCRGARVDTEDEEKFSTPRDFLLARPDGVYTVGVARRARAGEPYALDDADAHAERLARRVDGARDGDAERTRARTAADALRRALDACERDAAFASVDEVVITALARWDDADADGTDAVEVLATAREREAGAPDGTAARAGVYVDVERATARSPRSPCDVKYTAWIREREPYERALASWNEANPSERCAECVTTRVVARDDGERDYEILEGLTTNFIVVSNAATSSPRAHRAIEGVLRGATSERLAAALRALAPATADDAIAAPDPRAAVSDLLSGAFDAAFLTNAVKSIVPIDFAVVRTAACVAARVDFPATRALLRRLRAASDRPDA